MYLVAVYDVSFVEDEKKGQKRIVKLMKLFRKYLHHTQKSVFEGEISEAKFFKLKREVFHLISWEDSVVFYEIENKNNLNREILGKDNKRTDNIL